MGEGNKPHQPLINQTPRNSQENKTRLIALGFIFDVAEPFD